ncbi:MAG: CoA-binding protein, partial [Anaerolineaceae bacterium]|nr:CoA-binding protein [Anaerolineaceae bacterium]
MDKNVLDKMLRPKTVAIVGASATPGKIGYTVIDNLIKGGYTGKIYPVNPTCTEILGLKCYPSISEVPGEVDSAIITIPAKVMSEVTEACGKKGVK